MNTIDTSLLQLRSNLSGLVEQAHYTDAQIRLTRRNKPIARIVGENFMHTLDMLLAQDAGLRETLQVMLDEELVQQIQQSEQEVVRGDVLPLTAALTE